ncbi:MULTISPECIES: nitrite/sulfite reductase [unclassified Tenacibaculum]|uniref:nitrite/sulfite reductase n=1 Tax=unclassified Tenacibaculum TaxID=2635139 RepID=UPI001F44576D|nr:MULTISPECIES: nitrite/sulfite reductase [unclassified Tenacibaculum]MCF2873607.1 nitrite/sulfite reductase [Tenacibaculum sp. Cn5-1]MCF2933763.1 nitrite/sulfite reductase [Tenacibaculum sp. Cn5-34]MCG7509655.1 nitrite/sulfite reductase [Tenacibaculum sp. Cn5-46]
MQSFRTEIENPIVEKDILELERKIRLFKEGQIDEERFRSLRLARGVYGQRQFGVQMIRIKLPYGKVTSEQLHRIADVSDEYSRGRLHITTRQDIQIHYVSLDRTPELWAQLEKDDITLREACGNAVRNVTASETAGIDINEPFDVTPYAHATFQFFLRNPICQEMGRKFKMSFSATDHDTALSFMHDLGFIAKTKTIKGKEVKGFKVLLAGGLGSQPRHADVIYEFLEADLLIPTIEGVLRVFDRHGERSKRAKARLKFLVKDLGVDAFLKLVSEEQKAFAYQRYPINTSDFEKEIQFETTEIPSVKITDNEAYQNWKETNVIQQKQKGLYAIGIKVPLGDFYTDKARLLADLIKKYAANELRFTLRQNILIRHVREEFLPFFYVELEKLGFTEIGYNSLTDITACPGTDTCNLGISSSTGIATELERVLKSEYPQYVNNKNITIKISGCMNACGQHNMAHIGFQGMSVKVGNLLAPALQVLIGGGVLGNGKGRFSDKLVKIPSKRGPEALRILLNDFEDHKQEKEDFLTYYDRYGKTYFYDLLKHLSDTSNLNQDDFIDWGHDKNYVKAIGVGECAGVVIDLIATLLFESEEKIENAIGALNEKQWSDSIYHSYSAIINTAKALLTSEGAKTNTQASIIKNFDEVFISTNKIELPTSFTDFVYQIKENNPTEAFAKKYLEEAKSFYKTVDAYRKQVVES